MYWRCDSSSIEPAMQAESGVQNPVPSKKKKKERKEERKK
jgi:hypothetical protein